VQSRVPSRSGYSSDPDGVLGTNKRMYSAHFDDLPTPQFPSFHMDQVEDLDESGGLLDGAMSRSDNAMLRHLSDVTPRMSSNDSGLSPLQEGSEDISPKTGESGGPFPSVKTVSPVEDGPPGSSKVGDNLRSMQAMRGAMDHIQQQQGGAPAKASPSRKSKSSRSHSSEKKNKGGNAGASALGNLPAVSKATGSRGGSAQASKNSRASTAPSRKSINSLATQSLSQGSAAKLGTKWNPPQSASGSKKSMASRTSNVPSASTVSSRPLSSSGSVILTDDDESGSEPPLTVSEDGLSTKDGTVSGFSNIETKSGHNTHLGGSGRPGGAGPPPPPPFRRSSSQHEPHQQHDHQSASQYSSNAPVHSITAKGSFGETDTIVSDPTLDAGFDPVPPSPMTKNQRDGSEATGSYEKKYSDNTEAPLSSDTPSHESPGVMVVDNIVAAALAYAEKTHGSDHGTLASSRPPKSKSFMSAKSSKSMKRGVSPNSDISSNYSSMHSYYTEHEIGGRKSINSRSNSRSTGNPTSRSRGHPSTPSTGNPRFAQSGGAPVDDLVAQALSQAVSRLHDGKPQAPKPQARTKSDHSSHFGSAKSMGSMYSEDTDFTNQDLGMFDC